MMMRQRKGAYLCHGVLDNLLVRHIALVTDKELVDTLGGVAVDLLKPLLHVVERIHVGHIVDDTDTVGTTIVGRGDGTETLLTGGIPLLKIMLVEGSRSLDIMVQDVRSGA